MHKDNSKKQSIIAFLNNSNSSTILGISFLKWVVISAIVGSITGSVIALFLKSLEIATTLRINNPWLLFFLPIGGAFSFTGQVSPFAFLNKMVFTSFTLSTGFQGGEVTPLFVIGSTLGNALSNILHISPSFLAALGLIGVFAGATNAPIASFVLGLEMFDSGGMEYMFMTCAISYLFSGHTGIYISQKISTSKSKLIKVAKESTLAYYRMKNSENIPSKAILTLVGQLKFGGSSIELPNSEGLNIYKIKCTGNGIKLVRHTYNSHVGTWSIIHINDQLKYIDLNDKKEEIHAINITQSNEKKDKLLLLNTNLLKSIEIEYSVRQHDYKRSICTNNFEEDNYIIDNNDLHHIVLENQFKLTKCRFELPNPSGENIYKISVKNGKVRLCHHSYDPDGHTWSAPPYNNQQQYIDLCEGTHILKLFVGEQFGKNDKITLVNGSFRNSVQVSYLVEDITDEF